MHVRVFICNTVQKDNRSIRILLRTGIEISLCKVVNHPINNGGVSVPDGKVGIIADKGIWVAIFFSIGSVPVVAHAIINAPAKIGLDGMNGLLNLVVGVHPGSIGCFSFCQLFADFFLCFFRKAVYSIKVYKVAFFAFRNQFIIA